MNATDLRLALFEARPGAVDWAVLREVSAVSRAAAASGNYRLAVSRHPNTYWKLMPAGARPLRRGFARTRI